MEIDCLPAEMRVHIDRRSLPRWLNPSLLRLDDARCGVARVTNDEIMLAAPLDSCLLAFRPMLRFPVFSMFYFVVSCLYLPEIQSVN